MLINAGNITERKPLAKGYNLRTMKENDLNYIWIQHRTWNKRL